MVLLVAQAGHVRDVLRNWPVTDVRFICAADGGRVLGRSASGAGMPAGKLQLSTAAAMLPEGLLQVRLDASTDSDTCLRDQLYAGLISALKITGGQLDERGSSSSTRAQQPPESPAWFSARWASRASHPVPPGSGSGCPAPGNWCSADVPGSPRTGCRPASLDHLSLASGQPQIAASAIKEFQSAVLLGVSTAGKLLSREVDETMPHCDDGPVIFALSNPVDQARGAARRRLRLVRRCPVPAGPPSRAGVPAAQVSNLAQPVAPLQPQPGRGDQLQ
jgi:hypothetical protein